jgi:hypothetical protein
MKENNPPKLREEELVEREGDQLFYSKKWHENQRKIDEEILERIEKQLEERQNSGNY